MTTISNINALSSQHAKTWFEQICTASRWVELMVAAMPFANKASLLESAASHWKAMQKNDYLEAFQGHPMIGDLASLKKKYSATMSFASHEQSAATSADEQTLKALSLANHTYLDKNGFIFIICATGLSAQTMLNAIQTRLLNSTEEEIKIAAQEQLKISLLRIEVALTKGDNNND